MHVLLLHESAGSCVMLVCVCVCVCVHIYNHIHMLVCAYTYIDACVFLRQFSMLSAIKSSRNHMGMLVYVCVCVCVFVCDYFSAAVLGLRDHIVHFAQHIYANNLYSSPLQNPVRLGYAYVCIYACIRLA